MQTRPTPKNIKDKKMSGSIKGSSSSKGLAKTGMGKAFKPAARSGKLKPTS